MKLIVNRVNTPPKDSLSGIPGSTERLSAASVLMFLHVHCVGEETVLSIDVKLSVEGRSGFLPALFLLALWLEPLSTQRVVDT